MSVAEQPAPPTELSTPVSSITLEDGSTVELREGSRLNQTVNTLNRNTREVALEGEAFFDITSNPNKPFIIHTGRVKTTVLGTAFAIKALPDETSITVTVTKGKVKVEDGARLLATLEANQQFTYNIDSEHAQEKWIDAENEVAWRSHDLIFRNIPFDNIVKRLAEVYEVTIVLETEELKRRRLTASFDDRDSIETQIKYLCSSQLTRYVVEEGVYVIKPL